MKHLLNANRVRLALIVGLAVAATLVGGENRASAQQGKYVTQAATRMSKLIDAGNQDGYELHNNAFSLGGGWLKKNTEEWVPLYTVQLKAGKKYRFLASGDNDALDVDLKVTDTDGKQVAIDASSDPDAVVDYAPKASGRYTVHIRLYKSKSNADCVCVSSVMAK